MTEDQAVEAMAPKDDDEHAAIWLEPKCADSSPEGRLWADEDMWPDGCDECGAPGAKYFRTDLVHKRFAELVLEREAAFAAGAESMLEAASKAMQAAAAATIRALADSRYNQCERISSPDPETGICECSLESYGHDCLCAEGLELANVCVDAIRALPIPARGDGGEAISRAES